MSTDSRIEALRAIEDTEERARGSALLIAETAALAKRYRAIRDRAALAAVRAGMIRQKDALEITGVTRRALKKTDQRLAKITTPCKVCKAPAGKRCTGVPPVVMNGREVAASPGAVHAERYAAYEKAERKRLADERAASPTADLVEETSAAANRVREYEQVVDEALAIRKEALDALYSQDTYDGAPVWTPAALANLVGVTTARITHMGYAARGGDLHLRSLVGA